MRKLTPSAKCLGPGQIQQHAFLFNLHKNGEFNCKNGKSEKERKRLEFGQKLVCKGGPGLDVEQLPR